MTVGTRVVFRGEDRHRLRKPLTGEYGTVRFIAKKPDIPESVYVEFDRDEHRGTVRNGWWVDPNRLGRY